MIVYIGYIENYEVMVNMSLKNVSFIYLIKLLCYSYYILVPTLLQIIIIIIIYSDMPHNQTGILIIGSHNVRGGVERKLRFMDVGSPVRKHEIFCFQET